MEYLQISEASKGPTSFTIFLELPVELRLKIWHIAIQPRVVPYNFSAAQRSGLIIDCPIQPLLHVCHESRAEALKVYRKTSDRPTMYLSPDDALLWVRFNGPRTFRLDAECLENGTIISKVQHFAVSVKFWNRITTSFEYEILYKMIRASELLKTLIIVDDKYGKIKWGDMRGKALKLVEAKWPETAYCLKVVGERVERMKKTKNDLWKGWDAGGTFPETEVAAVTFARVVFQ